MAGNGRGPLSVHGAPISSMQIFGGRSPSPRVLHRTPLVPFFTGQQRGNPEDELIVARRCALSHAHVVQQPSMPGTGHHAHVAQRVLAMNRRPARGQHHVTTWDSGRGQIVLNGDWWPSLSPVGTPLLLPACCLRRLEGLVHLPSLQTVAQLGPVDRHLTHGS